MYILKKLCHVCITMLIIDQNIATINTFSYIELCLQLVFKCQGIFVLNQKTPSIRPLSFFSYEVNGSDAILARLGKKNSVSNQQLKEL